MSETRIGAGARNARADAEEAHRRSEEVAAARATSMDGARQASIARRSVIPWLPPTSDDVLREVAERTKSVPLAVADLSLYTDQALEREIDAARMRAGAHPGTDGDGDRLVLGRLQGELVQRHEPRAVDVGALTSRSEVEEAINRQRSFLARYRHDMTPGVRADHERTLGALWHRREVLLSDENACNDAHPVATPLNGNVLSVAFTADDLVVALKQQVDLTPQAEAQVRGTFERWHRDTCRLTGEDPTIQVSQHRYAEAKVDRAPAQQEELRMRLEMIEAARTSACAALAFLDSAARGESVSTAHARVMGAHTLSDVALTMPARPASVRTESPRADAREVEGLARKNADDARGVGHAQNTRFRGVDNSQFIRDPDNVTYGPWRKNADGPRSVEQARAIFEKQTGQTLPAWIKVVVDPTVPADRHAEYVFERSADAKAAFGRGRIVEDGVVVRVRPDVFESDEAIVGVLRHESYELENLARKNEDTDLTNADVRSHTAARRRGNLHDQAWDVADVEVRIMRETPGSPRHGALVTARDNLVARFALQNHGDE